MIDAKFVGEIIEYLMDQKIDKQEFLDERGKRLREEGVLNLLLAANCLAEVRNRTTIAPIATQLLEALKKEVEKEFPYEFDPKAAAAIVTAIATVWQDALQCLNWLKSCIQLDSSSFVRQSAVHAIAQNWKDHPDTLPMLKQWATSDDDADVRGAAVQELSNGWKNDPEIFELLCDRTLNDPFERKEKWEDNPRQTALKAIIKQRPDSPQTLSLLRDRADNDSDEKLRKFAKKKLEKWNRN